MALQLASGAICSDHLGCCGGYFGLVELLSFVFDAYITSVSTMAKIKERSMGKDVSHMDAYISDILYFIFYIIVNFGTLFGSVELPIFKMG